jgi:NAD(P)H-dependent flavin oxidoreductase YrpB (nitropropane dioxygenase family)
MLPRGPEGDPVDDCLPSGSVAGVIEDVPSCAQLVARVVAEAEQTLARLGAAGAREDPCTRH